MADCPPAGPSPDPCSSRSERALRVAGWTLGLSLVSIGAAGPVLAETAVHSQLRERFAVDEHFDVDESFAVDLDLDGLEVRGLARVLPDGRGHVRAARIRVRPTFTGVAVEIDGLDATLRERAPRAAGQRPKPSHAATTKTASPAAPAPDPLARMLARLRGVPLSVSTHGRVTIELSEDLELAAVDPRVELPGDGRIHGSSRFELGARAAASAETGILAQLEFETTDEDPRDLALAGTVTLGSGSMRHSLTLAGRARPKRIALELDEPDGGHARVDVERGSGGRDHVHLEAKALPLSPLEPIAQLFGRRLGAALGEREGRLELDRAAITGVVELDRGAYLTRAQFDAVELTGLRLVSKLWSAEPVELAALSVDGELSREHTRDGPRNFGTLVLGHRGAQLEFAAELDAAGFDIELQVPTTSCQTLLDATPGMSPVLAGTELSGTLDARFGLSLRFDALAEARARYLGDDAEPLELEDFEAPGELEFSLPYLERCTVERLGPGIDIEGLRGPYHHHFVSAAGVETKRVLAVGDDDYLRLASAPQLALAFVILEDARFWLHDGFDREQIERAFWFNLLEGRVSRGASTITQQAARSLWLGIDRSLTRKLAEAMLAAELERGLDKQRILEVYLNIIELGPEIHGIAEAARYHFGKEAGALTLLEALHLASLAPAPVAYSRRFADGHVDPAWREHLHAQLRRLLIRHLISPETAEAASLADLTLRPHPRLAPATHRDR